MTKKGQKKDFQKIKLKPGRTLPKGTNVTNTTFKTGKITPQNQLKSGPSEVSLKDLLNYLNHNNVSVKKDNLGKLTNYVTEHQESLVLFFPEVLKRVGSMLMDSDASVRKEVINFLHTVLQLLSDTQVDCFFVPLTSYTHCMMTHCNGKVRRDSLKLLNMVLEVHPKVFCQSSTVLQGLLNLISSKERKGKKRVLTEIIGSPVSSQEMRAEVLSQMITFLSCLFVPKEVEDEDEHAIYWDAKEPLHLPLHRLAGRTPAPMEVTNDHHVTNTKEFKDFVSDLVPLLFDIIKGEIPYDPDRDGMAGQIPDKPINSDIIGNLNLVVQVLVYVGEWIVKQTPYEETKDKELKELLTKMINQLFKYFPYEKNHESQNQRKSQSKNNEASCVLLNLGASYLHCLFVLDSGKNPEDAEEKMMSYLEERFNTCSVMNDKSISLLIKLIRICISSSNVNQVYKNGLLLGLYGVLETHKLSPSAKPLYSFFMDVSLEYDFRNLLDCEAMRIWFNLLSKEMLSMVETNSVSKKFFKYIRQVCARKYPYFQELLNKSNPENFLDFFKYDNEDLHMTVTQMITCLDQPCTVVLDGLIDVISDSSFSLNSATKIIRQLHARFLGCDVPDLEKLYFVRFLLNLGCDCLSLADPSSEIIIPDLLKSVMESCRFNLKPSTKWERHLKITEVCFECLPCYLKNDLLVMNILKFLSSNLYQCHTIPIHSAIALLKLRKISFEFEQNEDLVGFYGELLFSSLMYLSVMLSEECEKEDLKPYAKTELKNSLGLERDDITIIIQIIKINIHSFGETEMYHVLKMTRFFIHMKILTVEDRKDYYHLLESINGIWHRSNLIHPIWSDICQFFHLL